MEAQSDSAAPAAVSSATPAAVSSATPAAAPAAVSSAAPAAASSAAPAAAPAAVSVHSLAECAQALRSQLSVQQRVEVRVRAHAKLVVGTACSGTDCAIPCLEHVGRVTGWSFHHAFSCEMEETKQAWIRENFPSLPALFSDVALLGTGEAVNELTGRTEAVPAVDLFIAGFVCKSVSTENNDRGNNRTCIADATGLTGRTFDGVRRYVERFRPKLVICENVTGLLKRFLGAEPQIHAVRAVFAKLGYSFQHVAVDTRDFFLPQRRPRVWMWALRDGPQSQADEIKAVIDNLPKRAHMPLRDMLTPVATDHKPARAALNVRELEVLRTAVETIRQRRRGVGADWDEDFDVVVDLAKSTQRTRTCMNASTCVLPNSKLWLVRAGRFLTARECLALQGIWASDFRALDAWATHPKKLRLLHDLAGHAFITPVCMTVCLAVIMTAI